MNQAKGFSSGKSTITRKAFLKQCLSLGLGCFIMHPLAWSGDHLAIFHQSNLLHKARYWEKLPAKTVRCLLCPNECNIKSGESGDCHARGNKNGTLYSLVYSQPSVIKLDDIEKSPLYHYQVSGKVFSIATAGCNLTCMFCQNHAISQVGPDETETFELTPKQVIERAKKHGVDSINFFYTEPVVYFEYMLDIARLANKENMNTFCITAGHINSEPLHELIPYIDAFVVGLKGFDNEFYNQYIGVDIGPVKNTLKILAKHRGTTWFEVVNLLIPGLNDNQRSIEAMCRWIRNQLGKDVPLHFTRFEPAYQMKNWSETPVKTLERAYNTAKENELQFPYIGNIPGHEGNNTYCPVCGKAVIERVNYKVIRNNLSHGRCECGHKIKGHWL